RQDGVGDQLNGFRIVCHTLFVLSHVVQSSTASDPGTCIRGIDIDESGRVRGSLFPLLELKVSVGSVGQSRYVIGVKSNDLRKIPPHPAPSATCWNKTPLGTSTRLLAKTFLPWPSKSPRDSCLSAQTGVGKSHLE